MGQSSLPEARGPVTATLVIGVGLSGFFDGILLHQILQWHHLLSLVQDERLRDLTNQILADGIFHILMYAVVVVGLWLLWRRRSALRHHGARAVAGGALLGFGLWNIIDIGLFHWVLEIHHVRVGVPNSMTYDLLWLGVLGIVPVLTGWWLVREAGASGPGDGRPAAATLLFLVLSGAILAARPQPGSYSSLIIFRPDIPLAAAYNAVLAANGRISLVDGRRGIMIAAVPDDARSTLYRSGALFITRSPALAGCAAAIR